MPTVQGRCAFLRRLIGAVVLLSGLAAGSIAAERTSSLIGEPAPAWEGLTWLDGVPRELSDFRGKVVLIRWWTAPGCPFCRATASALKEFSEAYRERGLEVLGFYHHKSPEPLRLESVREHARQLGLGFPIAVDHGWRTLRRWWLNKGDRQWTSVSFLIDRRGTIRYVHPGGQYVKGDEDHAALKAKIEELLNESPP